MRDCASGRADESNRASNRPVSRPVGFIRSISKPRVVYAKRLGLDCILKTKMFSCEGSENRALCLIARPASHDDDVTAAVSFLIMCR